MNNFLELKKIFKTFKSEKTVKVLKNLSQKFYKGKSYSIMGPSGSGKSTLLNLISLIDRPSSGTINFDNQKVEFSKPMEARDKGIEVVYQDLALCDNLTAASNIFLTREIKRNFGLIKIINFSEMFKRAKDIFKDLKSETLPDEEVKMMSGGQRQAVAIGRTKLSKAKVVLLDEPTAAISVRQVAEVLELIKQLKNQGIAVVIISHRMPDVFAVSDRIAVLRRGQLVANKLAKESSPEEVTALITGAIEKA